MSNISITLLPEQPVTKLDFQAYLIGKEVHVFDYKLSDFDPNSGSTPTPLGTPIQLSSGNFPSAADDVYVSLKFTGIPGSTADLLVKLIDPNHPGKPIIEQIINYQFVVETNNSGVNTEPSKHTNGYIFVPVGTGGYASLFKNDGTPPPYIDLENALNDVTAEPGNGSTIVKDLNYGQCLHLAREIVWRHFPVRPPRPEGKIKALYDFNELTDGEIEEKDKRQEKRTRFESEVKKFYNDGEKEARRLAIYIFAFSSAKWAEYESDGIHNILFRFPIKLPNFGSGEINVIDLPLNSVGIPAEYFYAHGVDIPIEIGKAQRYEQIKSEPSDILLNIFKKATEQRIAALDQIAIPNHPLSLTYSYNQIIRLLRAQDTNRPELPIINAASNTDLKKLIELWAKSPEETSLQFWEHLENNTLNGFTLAEHASGREGHSDLVLFLLTQGNATLISTLDNVAVNDLAPLPTASETDWITWYQLAFPIDGSDGSVDFLPPGTTSEKAGYFAIHAINFFGNLSVTASDFSIDVTFHTPPVFSTEIGPIQQFISALGSLDALADPALTEPIISGLFPNDECAQEWLRGKASILAGLYEITKDITEVTFTDELELSVWEQLYALGITDKSQIQTMSLVDFKACVKGTILDGSHEYTYTIIDGQTEEVIIKTETYDIGVLIHDGANVPVSPEVENNFVPVNPGNLVNCIPPDYLSKTGRNAYLQDLLAFEIGDKTVSELLKETRRLSFDNLLVSKENAAIKIPRVDVVNSLLECALCKIKASDETWRGAEFQQMFCAMVNASNFNVNPLIPENPLAIHINKFWEQIAALPDAATQIEQLCKIFGLAQQSGNLNELNDVIIILKDLANTAMAAALLEFIEAMQAMDAAQFGAASAQVLNAMEAMPADPLKDFTAYLIESLNQNTDQYIDIGNTEAQDADDLNKVNSNCCDDSDETTGQSIPYGSTLNGAACAYEQLAVSTADPCKLPFHQPLAVSRAYLSALGTTRFELARKFSQHIHGFAYDPAHTPGDFKTHLYRYPVNDALALEYLGVSPQEYALYYEKTPLGENEDFVFPALLGYESRDDLSKYSNLGEFLKKNCLDCCDLECWLNSGFVPLRIIDQNGEALEFTCRDCDYSRYQIDVLDGSSGEEDLKFARLWHLTMLIRFARQLKKAGIGCYSCSEVALIADKLNWISYDADGLNTAINPQFLEQFVALDMLRSECGICFQAGEAVYLTDLLTGPSGANWSTVLSHLVEKIVEKSNAAKNTETCRSAYFVKLVVEHIDVLAVMAGFRSDADDFYKWYHQFTNIIRFAQVLCRVCDSAFTVGQLQFIFTTDAKLVGDDPYPQQTPNEALEYPFNLPDNSGDFDLETLREKLLNVQIDKAASEAWTWQKIEAHLSADFGYTGGAFLDMGKRFFPETLGALGYSISNAEKQFQESLAATDTALLMWNTGNVSPFFYIPGFLTCKIPLKSADVIQKLQAIRQLNAKEEVAVQNLFYAPRLALSPFAAFFENFTEAVTILTETDDESVRLEYFLQQFARFYQKCEIITRHFTDHVSDALGIPQLDNRVTWKILARLNADDNAATQPWENDLGTAPVMRFPEKIQAGAFVALTRLTGTGLAGAIKNIDGALVYREIWGGMTAYGMSENPNDCPFPTVVPNLSFSPQNAPLIAVVRNGNALTNGSPSKLLGGAQGYTAEYKGVLYITESGKYVFSAGAPTESGERPDFHQAKHSQWQLTLKRGNNTWIVLDNDWNSPNTPGDCSVSMNLKRGAYDIYFTFKQPEPSLLNLEDGCPQPTGWQIKWTTPYQSEWHTIPISHLYHKTPFGDLSEGVIKLHPTATAFLKDQYQPGISGIRRTALRVFAGSLLLHGSHISADPVSDSGMAEIDHLLNNPSLFEGCSHFKDAGVWKTHLAGFLLDFLPVLDNYCASDIPVEQRMTPSIPRVQALFQCFEQLWEIKHLKNEAADQGLHTVWLLWKEGLENHQDVAGNLQKYLGVGFDKTHLVTQFYSGFSLSEEDLLNEEWTIRVWEILKYIEAWKCKIPVHSWKAVKPAEWVNIDFNSKGNENLVSFITEVFSGYSGGASGQLQEINDRIRTESRHALTAYFTSLSKDAQSSLDDFLLMDASVGLCDQASRLDIAIEMVQTFLSRTNLGIENLNGNDAVHFTNKEEQIWSGQYASYQAWKTCKLRACYPENFVIHDIIQEDSKSPGFRLLKEELKKDVLTMPVSGGISKLTGAKPPSLSTLMPLQKNVASTITLIPSVTGQPIASGLKHWESADDPGQLNFWVKTAEQLNIPYLRVAAASLPLAGIQYGCQDASCCDSCADTPMYPPTEYFFWLIQSKYYEEIHQSYKDWENGNNIEELLYMKDKAVYFLGWSKIENGQSGAVQWSPTGIKTVNDPVKLFFKGRFRDSLWIEATNGVTALEPMLDANDEPIPGTNLPPGFRFDLATEQVITLPEIGEQLPSAVDLSESPFYFLYHGIGAPRFPKNLDATVYLISKQLQSNCEYKGAKEWLDYVLNTLNRDNHWDNSSDFAGSKRKALLMTYLGNLLAWSKHLHHTNTRESLNQAKMILGLTGKILGERPKQVRTVQGDPVSLKDFTPLHPGLNPRILCIYDEYLSQNAFLEHCLNHLGKNCHTVTGEVSEYGCHTQICCDTAKDCVPDSPYRFLSLINRAKEYANALSSMGNALQSALEKRDQEKLTFLQNVQSNQLTHLNRETKQNMLREAYFQVEALEKTLEITQTRLVHYQNLITVGLISQEQDYISLTNQSMIAQAASQALNAAAQFIMLFPEIFAPVASDVGGGTKTANSLQGGAAVAGAIAGILQTRAGLKNYEGGNVRREQEWDFQKRTLTIEVEQIKNQLVAANLRYFNAQKDLDNYEIQIDHSNQTLKYLRDKFSNQEFYEYQEKELSQLYYQSYECAIQVAYQAERAYRKERCYSNEQFLNLPMWNNSFHGLLVGENLTAALRNMEQKFMDTNHKRYELSKAISLYKEMPRAFLMIKYNGTSLIQISEDLFAFDHPSHYCRVYKSISVTIPCIVGPYVNVNACMTLKNSFVRVSPRLLPSNCSGKSHQDGYRMRENDDRFFFVPGGKDTLATSKALQDSGYHQLSFQDERNLTFEHAGVAAEFCFALKQSNNQFDVATISDIILETSYIAKEGGDLYGAAASEAVKYRLPGNGELLIDIPSQFPDAWFELQSGKDKRYTMELGRQDFPFLSFDAELFICQIELIIEMPPCQECDVIEIIYEDENCHDCDDVPIICQRSMALGSKVFHGGLVREFPVSRERSFLGNFRFPQNMEMKRLYLLVTYKAVPVNCVKSGCNCC